MPIRNGNITNGTFGGGSGGDGSGAKSIVVTSPDGSIVQIGDSSFNESKSQLEVALQAIGGGSGVPDSTKINYLATSKNTPTFAINEEYLLCVGNPNDTVNYNLTFRSSGFINLNFSLTHNGTSNYDAAQVIFNSVSISGATATKSQLNGYFKVKAYLTTASATVNNVVIPSGTILYTLVLNSALPITGGTNSLKGVISVGSIESYTGAINPSSNALLAVSTGLITGTTTTINQLVQPQTSIADIVDNVIVTYKNGVFVNSGLFTTNINKKYVKYFFVDPDYGSDTNTTAINGSFNAPFKTMAYAQTIGSTGSIFVIMGKSTEAAFTITKPNIDIMCFGTRSALCGFTNKVTINNTTAGSSIRFTGISFDGGVDTATTNVGGVYFYNGQTVAALTKADAGYMEMVGFDSSNNTVSVSKGTLNINGGKTTAPAISGSGTQVTLDNVGLVLGNASVASGNVLMAFESNWIAAATNAAINGVVGSTILLDGINFARADGTRANLKLDGNYDYQHCDFEGTGSTFGTLIGVPDNFTRMRLWKAPIIGNATYMYVEDPTTGEMSKMLIPSTPSGSPSLFQIYDWAADTTISNGYLSFKTGKGVNVGSDITYNSSTSETEIFLTAGKTYTFDLAYNSIQSADPSADVNTYQYTGSDFTSANITVTAGEIVNGVYTCTATSGTGSAQLAASVSTGGVMNVFTAKAIIYPSQCAVAPNTTSTKLYTYTQVYTGTTLPLLCKNGSINSHTLTRNTSLGGAFGDNNVEFNHPFNGYNPNEYVSCGGVDRVFVSNLIAATRFAYSKDAGTSFTSMTDPLANTVSLSSSLVACYASDIDRAVFIGSSGVSCRIDPIAGTFTQFNITSQGVKQCVRGLLSGVNNFVTVGNNNTWNQFMKSTDGETWLNIASNNLASILPSTGTVTPVYAMGGICQTKDSLKAWIVAVNDTANNITYLCSSSDLITFSSLNATANEMLKDAKTEELLELKDKLPKALSTTIQAYNGFNVNGLFCELISGVGIGASACAIMMYSSNTISGANKVVTNNGFWAAPSDWKTLTNPANLTTGQKGYMFMSGVFALWKTGGSYAVSYTADGGNTWIDKAGFTSFTSLMPFNDFQICSCSDVSASRKYSATYRNYYTVTTLFTSVWLGGQRLLGGTSSSSTVTLTPQTIATYSYQDAIGAMALNGVTVSTSANNAYLSVGVDNINKTEKVSFLSGTAYVIKNTFLVSVVGTNCTVSSTNQAAGLKGNIQDVLFGLITSVGANASIRVKCDYNNGVNKLGGGNNLRIERK